MSILIDVINGKSDLISGNQATDIEIENAEKILNVKFANDYKEYLRNYGFICYDGHELTGICKGKRLDVINVTLKEKEYNLNIPKEAYVIEQAHIDGIVIWQSENGEIYQSQGDNYMKLCNSLFEYINLFQNQ